MVGSNFYIESSIASCLETTHNIGYCTNYVIIIFSCEMSRILLVPEELGRWMIIY